LIRNPLYLALFRAQNPWVSTPAWGQRPGSSLDYSVSDLR
jgi:hypothetical protein